MLHHSAAKTLKDIAFNPTKTMIVTTVSKSLFSVCRCLLVPGCFWPRVFLCLSHFYFLIVLFSARLWEQRLRDHFEIFEIVRSQIDSRILDQRFLSTKPMGKYIKVCFIIWTSFLICALKLRDVVRFHDWLKHYKKRSSAAVFFVHIG